MKVDAPTRADVAHVAARMRERDRKEFLAVSPYDEADMLASLPDRFTEKGFCFRKDGEPVGIGIMAVSRPNVVTLGFFATDDFPRIALPVARFTRRVLFPAYRAEGVHRIEAYTVADYEDAHRWIEMVGLTYEATLRAFGRDGEDFKVFSWVDDARSPGA